MERTNERQGLLTINDLGTNTARGDFVSVEEDDVGESLIGSDRAFRALRAPLLALSSVSFGQSLVQSVIFPFAPFMVEEFTGLPKRELGYRTGYVEAAFAIGQFISSFFWGWIGDRFSQPRGARRNAAARRNCGRPSLLFVTLFAAGACQIAFGLSSSYEFMVLTRLTGGLLSGSFAIARASVNDLTDASGTQARGFAFLSAGNGVGLIAGPGLGALLVRPAQYRAFSKVQFLHEYPYFLPNFLAGTVLIASGIASWWFLSRQKDGMSRAHRVLDADAIQSYNRNIGMHAAAKHIVQTDAWIVVLLFALLAFTTTAVVEAFPIYALLPSSDGGLDFDARDIGAVLFISGCVGLVYVVFIYAKISGRLGAVHLFRLGMVSIAAPMVLLPSALHVARDTSWLLWIIVAFAVGIFAIGTNTSFPSLFVLTGNSVAEELVGSAHGLSNALSNLARAAAPIAGASTLAWSVTNSMSFPFDYYFVWLLLALICIITMLLSLRLTPRLNSSDNRPLLSPKILPGTI